MLYRLMLVDDEPEIREGMKEIIDGKPAGFRLVAEARDNGVDSAAARRTGGPARPRESPTLRMNFMDGLEMVEKNARVFADGACSSWSQRI
jgi:DNA-binding NarL/FixJ family response regulator